MKVLFLDVDGVLNCAPNGGLDGEKLDRLANICQLTGAVVVISSSWRKYGDQLQRLLSSLVRRRIEVRGSTPITDRQERGLWVSNSREQEIQSWLSDHPEVTAFVILDDDPMQALKHRQVLCQSDQGLTESKAFQAIKLLQGGGE